MRRLITPDDVRRLAHFDARPGAVVSLYLNVDGREYPRRTDYEVHLSHLLREARAAGAEEADLEKISGHVHNGIDRKATRSLAIFSCAARDFWEEFQLPQPTRHRVAVGPTPVIRPLELMLDEHERFAVVLVDRARARLFRLHLGVIEERNEWADLVHGQHEQGGWSQARFARHVEDEVHKHLKRVAEEVLRMFEAHAFDRLLLGGPDEVVAEFERLLHSYLAERLAGRISVAFADPVEAVRDAALQAEQAIRRDAETAVVARLRSAAGRKNGGVSGMEEVLSVLAQRRVDTLVVARGFQRPGWRCPGCGVLALLGPRCRACGASMNKVEDVVEEAIDAAVVQSARVEIVSESSDLDVMGRIGAILRY